MFYSINNGESWNKTGTDTAWAQSGCSWAVFHPSNHTIWYASTSGNSATGKSHWIGKEGGIFKITNEGQNFHQIADKIDLAGYYTIIYKLIIDPADSLVLYASTNNGILKTTDCEAQDPVWENKLSGLIWDMELKPGNSSVLYASQFNDEDSLWQIKRSQDYGETWLALQNQPDSLTSKDIKKQYFTIEVSKAKPEFLFCNAFEIDTNTFYYNDLATSNGWIQFDTSPWGFGSGHGFGVEQVANAENMSASYITRLRGYNIDTSNSFTSSLEHVDVEDIVYHPYNTDEIWICTHGGVEKSVDGGLTYEAKYDGLGVAQVEKMATSYTDPKFIIGGLYHDYVQITESEYETNWNPTWNRVPGFYVDGMKPLINNKDPRHMWGSGQWGYWRYSNDYFNTSDTISGYFTAFWQSIGVLNKQNPSVFYRNKFLIDTIPKEEVYRSTDYGMSGGTQEFISQFVTQFPLSIENLILGMYTPYTDGKYLITILREKNAIADFIWHLLLTKNANDPLSEIIWEEVSIPREDAGISAIEFDPENPDIIYLSYIRSSDENIATEMIFKIDCTNPSDPDTTDLTKILPLTTTRENSIAVEKGGDGGIYLATEFGVFFTNNEMQSNTGNEWQLVGKNLPHVPVNGIEINYISNTLRVGTWGRGFWELPLPCLNNSQPLIISNNTLWDSYMRLDRSVVVNSGATLTITQDARIAMPSESKIIVAPGGRLIVDGGTITNACPGTWNGVEVWGDNTAHQYPDEHGNLQQGLMILKNGATIENAIHGVLVGGFLPDGSWDWDKAGGIVEVTGNNSLTEPAAKFINNKWAITFLAYENFHPVTLNKMPNFSIFNNALFEVNENYPGTIFWYESHVRLLGVTGVGFGGCTFVNKTAHPRVGVGIECTSASTPTFFNGGFKANAICTSQGTPPPCEEEYLDRCAFENLKEGIRVHTPGVGTFIVEDAVFTDNSKGIKMNTANNATILRSEFYIGQASDDEIQECGTRASGYGIYMDNCTGFALEENRFYKAQGAPPGYYVGIRIAETQATDEIYKNYFEGLSYANYTEGKNWFDDDIYSGLAFFCDENSDNFADFYVVRGEFPQGGIQSKQGDIDNVTGNTFTSPDDETWHFYNGGDHLIEYYYCNSCTDETPDEENIFNVQPEGINSANDCYSHYGGGGEDPKEAVLTAEQRLETEQLYDSCVAEYYYYNTIFENLKDGGDTPELISTIENSLPGDMWDLREDLLDMSPHLSLEVLKSFADKTDVFPDTILFEVLSANPDELRKNELIDYLENKTDPLPVSMIDQLRETAYNSTYKTDLLQQMAHYNQAKTRAAHDMIRTNLNDSISDINDLRDWLTNIGGVRADEQIIVSYMYENDYTEALNLANQLPQKYDYNTENLADHEQYVDIIELYGQLWQEFKGINKLDSTELADIEYIAENNRSTAGSMARGILETWYDYNFCDCLNTTDTIGYKNNKIIYEPNAVEKLNELNIIVKPNPANQYTVFDYQIPEEDVWGEIRITDNTGKMIDSFKVSGKQGQKIWDTRNIQSGLYFYTFIVNDIYKSGKIIILK